MWGTILHLIPSKYTPPNYHCKLLYAYKRICIVPPLIQSLQNVVKLNIPHTPKHNLKVIQII